MELRSFNAGDVIAGRFRIARFVAEGGMGEVYEAEDLQLKERLAVKALRLETSNDTSALVRFRQEIQLARRVTHPNVCRIHDLWEHKTAGGRSVWFLTMEFLEGETLARRIERFGTQAMPVADILPLVQQVAAGLGAAHEAGIVHRDLVRRGSGPDRAVVTDFGLSRSFDVGTTMMGTPAYMPPEQIEGGELEIDLFDSTATGNPSLGLLTLQRSLKPGAGILTSGHALLAEVPSSRACYQPWVPMRDGAAISPFQPCKDIKNAIEQALNAKNQKSDTVWIFRADHPDVTWVPKSPDQDGIRQIITAKLATPVRFDFSLTNKGDATKILMKELRVKRGGEVVFKTPMPKGARFQVCGISEKTGKSDCDPLPECDGFWRSHFNRGCRLYGGIGEIDVKESHGSH